MSDHEIVYDDNFGIHTFKRIITNELGKDTWARLIDGWNAPNVDKKEEFSYTDM